jgi:hypothetical protein
MSYITNFSQNVVADTNNETSTPINAGLWWTGVATSTLGVAGIQVSAKMDQNAIVYVDQSPGVFAGIGTATISGTNTLNGTLTKFTRDLHIGDVITYDPTGTPQTLTITSITSDTEAGVSTASNVVSAKAFSQYYWDVVDAYNYIASIDNFGITVQAINSYIRLRIHNISSANQTYIRAQTALCPIVEAVPRSLDPYGNLKVTIKGNQDHYGFDSEYTPQGDIRSIEPIRQAGVAFEGSTLDPNFWITTLIAGGTVTQSNGRVDMLTNTTANGVATLFSNRKARHVAGSSNLFRMAGRFGDTGTSNNVRQFGAVLDSNYTLTIASAAVVAGDVYTDVSGVQYTILKTETTTTPLVFATGVPTTGAGRVYTRVSGTGTTPLTGSTYAISSTLTDGFFFQLSGTTFSVVTAIGGDVTTGKVDSGSFNGILGATYIPNTNMQVWEIYYNSTSVWFTINGELLHRVVNNQTPLSNTLSLHAFVRNGNLGGGTTNVGMYLRSCTIKQLGPLNTENTSKYITTAATTICKYGAGRLKRVVIGHMNLNAGALTLYDGLSASAPVIIGINIPKNAALAPTSMELDLPFHNGLTVVNANDCQVTIVYE